MLIPSARGDDVFDTCYACNQQNNPIPAEADYTEALGGMEDWSSPVVGCKEIKVRTYNVTPVAKHKWDYWHSNWHCEGPAQGPEEAPCNI